MKRLMVAIAVLTIAFPLCAARNWRVLGLNNSHAKTYSYVINDDGTWKSEGEFITFKDTDLTPLRCQFANGTIYVLCAGKGTLEGVATSGHYGKVIRFKPDGTRIDEDAMFVFDGYGSALAVSQDGRYVFVGIGANTGTYQGWIYRYDTSTCVLEMDFACVGNNVNGTEAMSRYIQEMCIDDDNYLYVALRGLGRIIKFDGNADRRKQCYNMCKALSNQLDLGGSICYSPTEKCLYHGGRTQIRKLGLSDLSVIAGPKDGETDWFFSSKVINGVPYLISYQKSCIYRIDKATLGRTTVSTIRFNDICVLPRTPYFTFVIR